VASSSLLSLLELPELCLRSSTKRQLPDGEPARAMTMTMTTGCLMTSPPALPKSSHSSHPSTGRLVPPPSEGPMWPGRASRIVDLRYSCTSSELVLHTNAVLFFAL
jgi:hypothetical protein